MANEEHLTPTKNIEFHIYNLLRERPCKFTVKPIPRDVEDEFIKQILINKNFNIKTSLGLCLPAMDTQQVF